MKKKILLSMLCMVLAAVSVLVVSCRKEAPDLLDLDMASIVQMTPGQRAIFDEAVQRLDKHISFDADAGQYVMATGVTAAGTGLSERFFNYFKRNFEATNTQLLQQKAQGYIAVEVSRNRVHVVDLEDGFDAFTKGGAGRSFDEIEKGGINSIETYWFGMTVKISNETMRYMLAGSSVVGTVSGLFPTAPTQVISQVCYYLDVALATGIVAYPNGVEIGVGTDGCYIKGQ